MAQLDSGTETRVAVAGAVGGAAASPVSADEAAALKAQVKAFWNRESCDTGQARSEKYSREYFEQIEQWRYRDQPFIHAFAQFTRYRDKRVLEVGFGAGTDFIQWLRAGAPAATDAPGPTGSAESPGV